MVSSLLWICHHAPVLCGPTKTIVWTIWVPHIQHNNERTLCFLLVQIHLCLLVCEAAKATINDQVEWRGYMVRVIWVWVGSMCVEGMGWERRWVRWVLWGTGTASGHPGVSWKISPKMRWLSQPVVRPTMGQSELWRRIGDGAYSITVGRTCRRGGGALCGLDVRRWGNSKRPMVILNMAIRSPRIRRCMRKNIRSCLRAASYGTYRSPFTNFRASLCTFSSASAFAAYDGMGCLIRIFKIWSDERFVQREKNIGGKGREGSL